LGVVERRAVVMKAKTLKMTLVILCNLFLLLHHFIRQSGRLSSISKCLFLLPVAGWGFQFEPSRKSRPV
jgi:hypothetical protein